MARIEIVRRALHDEVTGHLRAMAVDGRIPTGAKLNERELCQRLKGSRTPLREAIKRMAEGLVDLLPKRGAMAFRLSETDVLIHSRCWRISKVCGANWPSNAALQLRSLRSKLGIRKCWPAAHVRICRALAGSMPGFTPPSTIQPAIPYWPRPTGACSASFSV